MHETTMLQEDIITMASARLPWERLERRCVLVTGATGLLGSLLIKALLKRDELFDTNIMVLAQARNAEKAKRVFGDLLDMPELHLLMGDICEPIHTEFSVDYIVHAASETASKAFIKTPVETIRTTIHGTERVLELAREKQVKSMVYLSSLEVYGVTDPDLPGVSEADYGYIDPLSVRSSYSESKRMAENLCVSYAQEHGVPVKIARLVQTFGVGVDAGCLHVFAEFARCICQGKDIVLHTKGETMRNYCYTTDAISGVLTVLLMGKDAEAYNIANEDAYLSIKDMAERMCACRPDAQSKVMLDLSQDAAKFGYAPTVKIKLLTEKAEALGWRAEVGIDEMLMRLLTDQTSGVPQININPKTPEHLKVLHIYAGICENLIGGLETLMFNICSNISRSRIDLEVLHLSNMPNAWHQKRIESCGCKYYDLHTPCTGAIAKWKLFRKTYCFLEQHPYECVHVHSSSPVLQTALLSAAKLAGVKRRFSHVHACVLDKPHWLKRVARGIAKSFVQYLATDYFTCSPQANGSIYPDKLIRANKIIQINNGIMPEKYSFDDGVRRQYREMLQIDAAVYTLGLIGYIGEVKNQIFAIEVLNALKYYGIKLRLLLIGRDLGEEKHVRNLVQKYRLTEQVAFLGQREDVSSLLQAMDLLIMPSISEGLGIAAIEAQAAGLHVVASDGVPTEANITGLVEYVPLSEGPQAWAKAIMKYANGYERKDMSNAITNAGFDIKEISAFLEAFYLKKEGLHLA